MGVSRTIFSGRPQKSILLISVSQVTRITDINHQHPGNLKIIPCNKLYSGGLRK
jgi:hypothetical protein